MFARFFISIFILLCYTVSYSVANNNIYTQQIVYNTKGVISSQLYQHLNRQVQLYKYQFDALQRLTKSEYIQPASIGTNGAFNTNYNYTLNGDITHLNRYGLIFNGTGYDIAIIDSLVYSYDKNNSSHLLAIDDWGGNDAGYDDVSTNLTEFEYDANGSLSIDRNRELYITHDLYNKVDTIRTNNNKYELLNIYAANGLKLSQRIVDSLGQVLQQTIYTADYLYKENVNGNVQLEQLSFLDGHYVPTVNGQLDFLLEIRNNTTNLQLVVSDLDGDNQLQPTEVLQENHYYPFGMQRESVLPLQISTEVLYQFNGGFLTEGVKQRFEKTYLPTSPANSNNYIHLTYFRLYDDRIGRWMEVDPAYKEWESPYAAMANNPIQYMDPLGDDTTKKGYGGQFIDVLDAKGGLKIPANFIPTRLVSSKQTEFKTIKPFGGVLIYRFHGDETVGSFGERIFKGFDFKGNEKSTSNNVNSNNYFQINRWYKNEKSINHAYTKFMLETIPQQAKSSTTLCGLVCGGGKNEDVKKTFQKIAENSLNSEGGLNIDMIALPNDLIYARTPENELITGAMRMYASKSIYGTWSIAFYNKENKEFEWLQVPLVAVMQRENMQNVPKNQAFNMNIYTSKLTGVQKNQARKLYDFLKVNPEYIDRFTIYNLDNEEGTYKDLNFAN